MLSIRNLNTPIHTHHIAFWFPGVWTVLSDALYIFFHLIPTPGGDGYYDTFIYELG